MSENDQEAIDTPRPFPEETINTPRPLPPDDPPTDADAPPESPVEFAKGNNINASTSTLSSVGRPLTKAERLLGTSQPFPSRQSSRRSSSNSRISRENELQQQIARTRQNQEPDENWRESFMDFAGSNEADVPAATTTPTHPDSPFSASSEFPTFAKRRAESIIASNPTNLKD